MWGTLFIATTATALVLLVNVGVSAGETARRERRRLHEVAVEGLFDNGSA
jgi:hypothetical protein